MFQGMSILHCIICINYCYLNFNCCSSELATVIENSGKDKSFGTEITWQFCEANSLWTWMDEASHWLPGWKDKSGIASHFCHEIGFQNHINSFLCIDLCVVCTLTMVPDTLWAGVSLLRHGPVLNHPLEEPQYLSNIQHVSISKHHLNEWHWFPIGWEYSCQNKWPSTIWYHSIGDIGSTIHMMTNWWHMKSNAL